MLYLGFQLQETKQCYRQTVKYNFNTYLWANFLQKIKNREPDKQEKQIYQFLLVL